MTKTRRSNSAVGYELSMPPRTLLWLFRNAS